MQEEDLSLIETHVGLLGEYTEVPLPVCRAFSLHCVLPLPFPLSAAPCFFFG